MLVLRTGSAVCPVLVFETVLLVVVVAERLDVPVLCPLFGLSAVLVVAVDTDLRVLLSVLTDCLA